jgi:hypothetical protein
MWRREKRLEYWLAHANERPTDELSFALRLKDKLRLNFVLFPISVNEESLMLETRARGGDESMDIDISVRDGLESISPWTERMSSAVREIDRTAGRLRSIELLDIAQVQNLKLPNKQEARIQQPNPSIQTTCRSLSIDIALKSAVGELAYFINPASKIMDWDLSFIVKAEIKGFLPFIKMFPYKRKSLKISDLPDSECRSFLREAEAIKGLPVDRAELLAVFRNIPFEMISKMRYLANNKAIIYTISNEFRRTQARVHDMAAIRDTVSQDIHLIPHRTRFRLISLN